MAVVGDTLLADSNGDFFKWFNGGEVQPPHVHLVRNGIAQAVYAAPVPVADCDQLSLLISTPGDDGNSGAVVTFVLQWSGEVARYGMDTVKSGRTLGGGIANLGGFVNGFAFLEQGIPQSALFMVPVVGHAFQIGCYGAAPGSAGTWFADVERIRVGGR